MRRLPVYLLLDVSGSMSGEPIEAVKNGVQTLVSVLRQDPYALETAFISVITFSSDVKQVVPLIDLMNFQTPTLEASGYTELGAALKFLAHKIAQEVVKTTQDRRGDWKPLVFLMTDGDPTDDWKDGLRVFKQAKIGLCVACAAGMNANIKILQQITENVVQLDTADAATIQAFFKWVSASITISSQKVDLSKKNSSNLADLPPAPPEVNVVSLQK